MSRDLSPIQDALEVSLSNLYQLGSNLQTRIRKIENMYLPKNGSLRREEIYKKIINICDLTRKSVDNIDKSLQEDFKAEFYSSLEDSVVYHKKPKILQNIGSLQVIIPSKILLSDYLSCRVNVPFKDKNVVDTFAKEFKNGEDNLPTDFNDCIKHVKKKKKVAFVDKPIIIDDCHKTKHYSKSNDTFDSDNSYSEDLGSHHNNHWVRELDCIDNTKKMHKELSVCGKEPLMLRDICFQMVQKSIHGPLLTENTYDSNENGNTDCTGSNCVDSHRNKRSVNLSLSLNKIHKKKPYKSALKKNPSEEGVDKSNVQVDSDQDSQNSVSLKSVTVSEDESASKCEQDKLSVGKTDDINHHDAISKCDDISKMSQNVPNKSKQDSSAKCVASGESNEGESNKDADEELKKNEHKCRKDKRCDNLNKKRFEKINNVNRVTKRQSADELVIDDEVVGENECTGVKTGKNKVSKTQVDKETSKHDSKMKGFSSDKVEIGSENASSNESGVREISPVESERKVKGIDGDINNVSQTQDVRSSNETCTDPVMKQDGCAASIKDQETDSKEHSDVDDKPKSYLRCINIDKLLSSPKRSASPQSVDEVIVLDTPSPADKKSVRNLSSKTKTHSVHKRLFKSDSKRNNLQKDVSKKSICQNDIIKIDSDEDVNICSGNIAKDVLDKIKSDIESNRCIARVNITEMGSLHAIMNKYALKRITKYGRTIIKKSVMDDNSAKKSLLNYSSSEDDIVSEGAASADDSDSDISALNSLKSRPKLFKLKHRVTDKKSPIDSDKNNSDSEMGRRLRGRNTESDGSTSGKDKNLDAEINKLSSLNNVGKHSRKNESETSSDSTMDKAKKRKVENEESKPMNEEKATDKNGIENHEEDEIEESTGDEMSTEIEKAIMNESSGQKIARTGKDAEALAKSDLLDSNDTDEIEKEEESNKEKVENEKKVSGSTNDLKTSRSRKKRTKDKLLAKTDNYLKMVDTEDSANDEANKKEDDKIIDESSSEVCSSRKRSKVVLNSDSEGDDKNKKVESDTHSQSGSEELKKSTESSDSSSDDFRVSRRKSKPKKVKDSNDSDDSSSDDRKGKKKGRIIKNPTGDSDNSDKKSDDDSEEEGTKKGRKNIRRLMRRDDLEEATLKAEKEERLRRQRISDRQKLYNSVLFDESGKPEEAVVDKVVIDFDPDTKEPIIQVDSGIVKKLKPHQANGVKFMWDACFESVKQIEKRKGSGCILAHCMGLGKTLQVISLIHTLLSYPKLTKVQRILVVCPLSTVLNWVNEFKMWLKFAKKRNDISIYELSRFKQNYERAYQLQEWLDEGGVCVLGYEMFRNLSADNPKKFRKKMLKSFQESLVDPGPDLVICDEGHLLKNEKTSLSQSMNRIKTRRRIVLTGTPLQNNLKEYYCMVQFVKPNLLGKYNEYLNRFVNPITNGQYTDSTDHDIRIMKRRSHVLHKLLDGAVQRRDYAVLAPFLPPKHEYVIFITVTDIQTKLYQHYLDNYSRRPHPDRKNNGFLFPDFQSLQRIWTHPLVLKANSERYELMLQKKRDKEEEDESEGSLADFIDDDESDASSTNSSSANSSDEDSIVSDDSRKKSKKKKDKKPAANNKGGSNRRRGTRANPVSPGGVDVELEIDQGNAEVKKENPTEWWIPLVSDVDMEDMALSNKLVLLFEILRECEAIGDKVLVFSQSLYSLDLIEQFLSKIDEATQQGTGNDKLCGHVGSWSQGLDYFRLDGQTSCENRSIWCKSFNREDNPRARLFLISTRAGGLGINLVAANRVIIFDVSWNPSHDVQSIFRIYRFGQKKPCYVYRFLAMGTMEEKIYERQVTKQAISKRVIDEQQIDRHYAENDLAELYVFTPKPLEPRPLPSLPKDRLFAELLKKYEALIYKYHEHDSLLENKEEETLTEEERKAAWEDFENEKNKPPPLPNFPNMNMMNMNMMNPGFNGMGMAGQTSLMINNLMGLIRKENPTLTEQQLTSMIPTLFSRMYPADQSIMQKMTSLLGFQQQQQMAPGMMPGLSGVPVGAGGLGTMGYQSWQHQQIQNMQRLQQQHQSGMKFYAGGLGSRDPISMAEAQQRQREMILTGMADNIPRRGRPPGTVNSSMVHPGNLGGIPTAASMVTVPVTAPKRLQPIHRPGDVVNLDDSE